MKKKTFYTLVALGNILLIVLILSLPWSVKAKECSSWDKLTLSQQERLEFAYDVGKHSNFGWTLAAIALKESSAGKFRLNLYSDDIGLFMINHTTAERTLGVTNYYKKLELHQRLVYDDELGGTLALSVLKHFHKQHKGNWKKVVRSYNEGNSWWKNDKSAKKSLDYYESVKDNLVMLRRCSGFE